MPTRILLCACFALLATATLTAQTRVSGTVRDAATGEPLPAANLQIDGTYQGTITNDNGRYTLDFESLPATLVVSYIGYATERVSITSPSATARDIALTPIAYELEPITVTGEDPAVGIMREVIRRKQEWRRTLDTYRADAYTRQQLSNDSGIVSIMESVSTTFWDREEGPREVIRSRRQTANISAEENFAGASYIPNLYDDDIEIMGFTMIGPTHPDALDHYHFVLLGRRHRDDRIVYDISVRPKSKLQAAFVGTVAVLDEEFAMIAADLTPSETILFPDPIQDWAVAYKQQFSNFGREYWLPVDVRIEGSIRFGFVGLQFPPIGYRQVSRLTDYAVNVALPDSLYASGDLLRVDSLSIRQDTLLAIAPRAVPLSEDESAAYDRIDSTSTLEKAYRPTGFLTRFIDFEEDEAGSDTSSGGGNIVSRWVDWSPQLWYNRVDGGHVGLRLANRAARPVGVFIEGGYKTELEKWALGGGLDLRPGVDGDLTLSAAWRRGSVPRYRSDTWNRLLNSILPLAGRTDYFDYMWSEAVSATAQYRLREWETTLSLGFHSEAHESLSKTTDWSLLNRDYVQRPNPGIDAGRLRSLSLVVEAGEDYIPFGVVGQRRARLAIEHASPDLLGSEFDFTRVDLALDWRINTFYRRRILPNALDLHVVAGSSSGTLPVQRFGILDGSFHAFKPFGAFRTLVGRPYEGERWAALFWEHNFRTVPFEGLGLWSLARMGTGVIVWGGHGRTWLSDETRASLAFAPRETDGVHHELGVSVTHLFKLFRLDLGWRLDRPGAYLGFGMTRFF